jgi:hypothetical protein
MKTSRKILLALAASAAMVATAPAFAYGRYHHGSGVVFYSPPPVVYLRPPVYYAPPVAYAPAPVYGSPAPVFYSPAPIHYYRRVVYPQPRSHRGVRW